MRVPAAGTVKAEGPDAQSSQMLTLPSAAVDSCYSQANILLAADGQAALEIHTNFSNLIT